MNTVGNPVQMKILIIDDEETIQRYIGGYLQDMGHKLYTVSRGEEGIELLKKNPIDIVITDVKMPGIDGFEVLRQTKQISSTTEVIMVTAYGDINGAVRAIRDGAFDFFTKPVKLRDLTASLERTARFHALRTEKDQYKERLEQIDHEARKQYGLSAVIGNSPAIQRVKDLIVHVGQTEATTVLLCGETGTGKELVARAIQYESSRVNTPFIAVDCSSISETLIESEFFGHTKGAFTGAHEIRKGYFEAANGGTLFLDEIGDMDILMQSRLLRTLEERTVRKLGSNTEIPIDVRVISATNKNLPEAVSRGEFREDLYYRLNTFTIEIPSLRERPEDIMPLAQFFLKKYSREMRRTEIAFDTDVETHLKTYHFPGNVREIRNIIERAVIMCQDGLITSDLLRFTPPISRKTTSSPVSLNLEETEKNLIQEALKRAGNKGDAAQLLGISRDALRRRLERYHF